MQRERFIVKFVSANNCFALLPFCWLDRVENEEKVIEISHKHKIYYFSCSPRLTNDRTLCIGAIYAKSLSIQERDEVFVSSIKNVPSLSSINISPLTANDRELLELQVDKVQSTLLAQVRVVAKGQPIVAWVSKFSSVTCIVEDTNSKPAYGLLKQFTEVHVLDTVANARKKIHNTLAKILPYLPKEKNASNWKHIAANRAILQRFCKKNMPCVYRVLQLPVLPSSDSSNAYDAILLSPSYILIPRCHLPKYARSTNGTMICRIKKMLRHRDSIKTIEQQAKNTDSISLPQFPQELIARIYVLENILEKCTLSLDKKYFDLSSIHLHAYISDSLRITLNLATKDRIIVEILCEEAERTEEEDESSTSKTLKLFPSDKSVTAQVFKQYVEACSRYEPLLLNSCSIIPLDNGRQCVVFVVSCALGDYTMINKKNIQNLKICIESVLDSKNAGTSSNSSGKDSTLEKISKGCMQSILKDCEVAFSLSLGLLTIDFQYDRENILICGGLGSGKTTVCKILIECYNREPYFLYTDVIDCRSLKGKKLEIIQKIVKSALENCVFYQPSILFLEDLESITNDGETMTNTINASRTADMLLDIFTQCQNNHYISIVATCASLNKIGSRLRPERGMQFFRTVLTIPKLEKADRIDILRLTLEDELCVPGDMNWDYYGNKTEGWMPQDLVDLTEKVKFAAWKRHVMEKSGSQIVMTDEDFRNVLENYTPLSIHGVQLYKTGGYSWSDIGGLSEVKNSLTEILRWPLKYPEIFKNAPIKLQSGVLLYGMPGTGKTMLAKAIASECGVNLISIKGPELLSKYIGVSEESVRNVFEKACRAKPCVLFFDEFDSLAPRRGHDSAGVTDRVVNQLLTQLDGVEDREGVAVVAATSRPDLLDPALLRPGRLDKALHCPLPNETEREAIFTALCNSQNIDKAELNLEELAKNSDGFTGADINAVITQARLAAYEDAVASATDGKVDVTDIKVTQVHLVKSLRSTTPSLSNSKKLFYTKLYARFSKQDTSLDYMLKKQKATLA